jgi:hypothetical protein
MTNEPGASCKARNFLALSAWLTVMAGFLRSQNARRVCRQGHPSRNEE